MPAAAPTTSTGTAGPKRIVTGSRVFALAEGAKGRQPGGSRMEARAGVSGMVAALCIRLAMLGGVAAGCADGGGGDRTSGRLALPGRDLGDLFFWKERTLGFTRRSADPALAEPQDLWVWPLDQDAPLVAMPGVDWALPGSWPRSLVGDLLLTGAQLDRLYDLESRQAADLSAIGASSASPVTPLPALGTVIRSDGGAVARRVTGAGDTLIVGRPPALATVALPGGGVIGGITFMGADPVVLYSRGASDTATVGVYRLEVPSGSPTPLIEPGPASAWIGAAGFCGATSGDRCGHFTAVGCGLDEPLCPGGRPPPCLLVYAKVEASEPLMITGGYAYDAATGTSERLDGDSPDRFFFSREHHLLVWGSSMVPRVHAWDLCTGGRSACDFPPGDAITWRSDGRAFATYGETQGLAIADLDAATCSDPRQAAPAAVVQARYAPAGDRLVWVAQAAPGAATETAWMSGTGLAAPVALATAPSLGVAFSPDGERLFLVRFAKSSVALSWIDAAAPNGPEQILSTSYGSSGRLGSRRALFLDHWNSQDDTGDLVLVDLVAGDRQIIASSVAEAAISGDVDAGGTQVACAVRTRSASARDGLWLNTLPP